MKKLVHTREISIRTSDLGDHYVLVEGSLIDHQEGVFRYGWGRRVFLHKLYLL